MTTTSNDTASQRRLVMTRTFNAPRELVWQAWTQREHLLQWYAGENCVPVFADLDLRPGGQWRSGMCWKGDKTLVHYGEYREIDPPRRLVFTHAWEEGHPDEPCQTRYQSVITVTLEEQDGGTHMTFEQVGFISDESRDSHRGGWGAAFDQLAGQLQRDVTDDRIITFSRVFSAPREMVWRAYTEADQLARWYGPRGFSARIEANDLRTGGKWRYVMIGPDGTEYSSHGVFREVVPMQRLVTTDAFGEGDGNDKLDDLPKDMVVTLTFEELGGATASPKTRLTVRIEHPTAEDRRKHEAMGVIPGFHSMLDCLDEHLASAKQQV
jgi:uncharacterized protein YndB with AHSA1/START domain